MQVYVLDDVRCPSRGSVCVHGQEAGMSFQNRQMVESQVYKNQICLDTGERADHGNDFTSSPFLHCPFLSGIFLSLRQRETSFSLFYSFYYDLHLFFMLQEKDSDPSFLLIVPMAHFYAS